MANQTLSQPQTVRLQDYRPPAFLVDGVELDFDLVRSRLALRRNPAHGDDKAELRLDGENLRLKHLSVDGVTLPATAYAVDEESLTISEVPDAFVLSAEVEIDPEDNARLEGLYRSRPMPQAARCCCRTAIWSSPGRWTMAGISPSGRTPSPSRVICSPWWPATWVTSRIASPPCPAAR